MAEGRIKITGEETASAIVQTVGKSVGDLTANVLVSTKAVADLKKELQEAVNAGQQGSIAAISAQLDQAIPQLQAYEQALKDALKPPDSGGGTEIFDQLANAIRNPTDAAAQLGGVLKDSLLGTLGETGLAIGGVITVAGAAGYELLSMAEQASVTAAKLNDIREISGMSAPSISAMGVALGAAGGSIDQLNSVLFMLEQRMENSGKKVDTGLKAIGLSLKEIQDADPDERLLLISDAFRSAGDETNKAAAAMDIFGRQGRDMLPELLKPLREFQEEARKLGLQLTDEDTQGAEDFETSLKRMNAEIDAANLKVGMTLSPLNYFREKWVELRLEWAQDKMAYAALGESIMDWGRAIFGAVPDVPKVTGDAKKGLDDLKKSIVDTAFHPVTLSAAELKDTVRVLDDQIKESIKTNKEAQKAATDWAKANADANSSMADLSGAQVAAIEYYHAQNVGVGEIAKTLQVYENQVRQVIDADKLQAQTAKDVTEERKKQQAFLESIEKQQGEQILKNLQFQNAEEKKNAQEGQKIWREYYDGLAKDSQNAFDYQRTKLSEWQDDQEGSLDYSVKGWETAYEAIQAEVARRLADIQQQQDLMDVKVKFTFVGPEQPAFNALTASFGENLQHNLSEVAKGIPTTLTRALEGGGGLQGAAESIGAQFGGSFTKSWAEDIEKDLPGKLGSALGSIIGPLGSLVGPLLSKLFSIGGPSKEELAGRKSESAFEGQFAGFSDMMTQVGAAYAATGRTAAQAQADVKAMFDAEKQGADATAAAVKKVNDVLEQQKAFAQDASDATSGLGGFFGTNTGAMDQADKIQKQMDDLKTKNNDVFAKAGNRALNPDEQKQTDQYEQQFEALKKQLDQVNGVIDATAVKTQESATAMGAAVAGAFNLDIQSGKSFSQALKDNLPAIDALRAELDKAGLDGGAAFNMLTRQVDLLKDPIAGPVLNAVNSLSSGFKGLAASGTETKEEFQGFAAQVLQSRDALVAQGKDGAAGMLAEQGPLQELWEEEQKYHFALDDGTKALLDQAEAAGEVGETHKSTTDQMLDAENKLVDVMSAMATAMGVTLPASVQAGVAAATGPSGIGGLKDAINKVPTNKTITFDIKTNGDVPDIPPGQPDGGWTGGFVTAAGIEHFDTGGIVGGSRLPSPFLAPPNSRDTTPLWAQPGEVILNAAQQKNVAAAIGGQGQGFADLAAAVAALQQELIAIRVAMENGEHLPPVRVQIPMNDQVIADRVIYLGRTNANGTGDSIAQIAQTWARK